MNINNKFIFKSTIIIIILLLIFKNKDIKLNVILSLIIASGVIIYLYKIQEETQLADNDKTEEMLKTIQTPIQNIKKYNEFIPYLFWIQDFYKFNPESYNDLSDTLSNFFILYEEGLLADHGKRYEMMLTKKHKAINILNSFSFNIPQVKAYRQKLEKAMSRLDGMLQPYLNEIKNKNDNALKEQYNFTSVVPISEPLPNDFYDEKEFDVY